MFHVELRQFPYATRAFNLSSEQLEERILRPWAAGRPIQLNDRRWTPEKARLAIYEGPAVETGQMGLGRGWANATRAGVEVTARMLTHARREAETPLELDQLKRAVLASCGGVPVRLPDVMGLAESVHPNSRVSERLGLAERAVWELLHAERIAMRRKDAQLAAEQWAPVLLSWSSWSDPELCVVLVQLPAAGH